MSEMKPAKICPHCGEVRNRESSDQYNYPQENFPHTDPFDCIRYLSDALRRANERLDDRNL